MFTNTYRPHVGGVASSVGGLVDGLRELGHQVLVVAPEFPGASVSSKNTIRIPALQNFAGSDFSLPSPVSGTLLKQMHQFAPDIVHSHHPFLLGGTALRVAAARKLPIVYSYHTRYDLYGNYVISNSDMARRLVRSLSLGYCDLCDAIIAPSKSTFEFITKNGVETPVTTIPTGVNTFQLKNGGSKELRLELNIPQDSFVVGHVGRLAHEKNLGFLSEAISDFLLAHTKAHALIAGDGAVANQMRKHFDSTKVSNRVHMLGVTTGERLANVYGAMNVFAFSSVSETQGLVITEAMAAGVPIVALDASGVRDAVVDGKNGRLLPTNSSVEQFADLLTWVSDLRHPEYRKLCKGALHTSKQFSETNTVRKTLDLYASLIGKAPDHEQLDLSVWKTTRRSLAEQWNIIGKVADAITDAVLQPVATEDE